MDRKDGAMGLRRACFRFVVMFGVVSLLWASALPPCAPAGNDNRLEQTVILKGVAGSSMVPLPQAMRQVSQQTGLMLVIADSPKVRETTVSAGQRPLKAVLEEVASVTDTELKMERGGAVWEAWSDRHARWLLNHWEGDRKWFERPFAGMREALIIMKLLSPEQRWRVWGEGRNISFAELSAQQRERLVDVLRNSTRQDIAEMAATLTSAAILDGYWELRVELHSSLGNYLTVMREKAERKPPSAPEVDTTLDALLDICNRALQREEAPAPPERGRGRLVRLPAAVNGFYSLEQMVAAIRQQGGQECYVDARIKGRMLFASGHEKGIEVGSLKEVMAHAMGSLWRSVGGVEILTAEPYREVRHRMDRFSEIRPHTEREFDNQFIKLARLWIGEVLRPLSDAHLRAGAFPYKMVLDEMPGWLDIKQMQNGLKQPIADDVVARFQQDVPAGVFPRLNFVVRITSSDGKTILTGASGFQFDPRERDKLFGRK